MPEIFGSLATVSEVWWLKVILLLFCIIVLLRRIGFFVHLTSCLVFLLFAMELLKFNLARLVLIDFLYCWAIFLLCWLLDLFLWLRSFNFSLLLLDKLNPLLVFVE